MKYLFLTIFTLISVFSFAQQCPATISSLGNGNGLQICWIRGEAPATLDSITYDSITYAGNFVNGGQGDCWRTTDPATTGTNGNHQIAFNFDGVDVVCSVINGIVDPTPRILSVEYNYFNIVAKKDGVELLWETAEEENNDFFQIERSEDGINFRVVDQLRGEGVAKAYRYKDESVAYLKGTFYYRLKQVDFDGTSNYTVVKSVTVGLEIGDSEFRVFPNPAKDKIFVVLEDGVDSDYAIRIFNIAGQLVSEQQISAFDSEQANYVSLEGIEQGYYIAKVESSQFSKSIPFVKQ